MYVFCRVEGVSSKMKFYLDKMCIIFYMDIFRKEKSNIYIIKGVAL